MEQTEICNTNFTKSRGWTFTINNYTKDDIKNLQTFKCEYLFQEETGEKGTPHLQGMLYYKNAVSFKSIKKLLPTAHIEKMKSKIASIKYCSKEETRTGEIYSNMNLSDLALIVPAQEEKKEYKSRSKRLDELVNKYLEERDYWYDVWLNNREKWELKKKCDEIPQDFLHIEEINNLKI